MSDLLLINEILDGSDVAFEKLIQKYQDKVFNVIFRYIGNYEDSLDLTQQVFINVFRKIDSFKGKCAFSTWLYRIAFNEAVSFLRIKRKEKTINIDNDFRGEENQKSQNLIPASKDSPSLKTENSELQNKIYSALSQIDSDSRQILILREVEACTYEEIADIVQLPLGTVRSKLHRARLFLKEKLSDYIRTF